MKLSLRVAAAASMTFIATFAVAQTNPYWVVTKSGFSTLGGNLGVIDTDVSINFSGNVALTGTVTEGTASGSAAVFVPYKDTAERVSSSLSATINQAFVQINDSDYVVTRQRLSGSPPSTRIMAWKLGTFGATVASSTDGVFNSVTLPSIANDGSLSFTALTAGSTIQGLYANPDRLRGLDELVTGLPSGTYRPLIADGGNIVSRTTSAQTGAIAVYKPDGAGSYLRTTVSTGFTETGLRPGIADNASAVAFFGKGPAGTGVFVYDFDKPMGERGPVAVALEGVRFQSAPNTNPVIASFSADNRVAVERVNNLLNQQLRVVFVGKDSASGQDNIFTARIDRATQQVYGLTSIARVGSDLPTDSSLPLPASFNLHDPINTRGQIVFQTGLSGGEQAVVGFQSSQFSKFKQGNAEANPFNTWANERIHPTSLTADKFLKSGCFQTNLAMTSSFYGIEQTPLAMRDYLNTSGRLLANGRLVLDTSLVVAQNSIGYVGVTGRGGNFNSIVSALRGGDAVMLSVPSSDIINTGAGTNFHAILAYGIDESKRIVGTVVTPSDIFIADPGQYLFYAKRYGSRYTQGEELLNLTLKDVFDNASDSGDYKFVASDWFNTGTFQTDGGALVTLASATPGYVGPSFFSRNMTFFDGVLGAPMSSAAGVRVESPIDVALTDPTTLRRYVSSSDRALPGDVLLTKTFADMPGQATDDGSFTPEGPESAFPGYFLNLPSELVGKSLDVALYGTGDGSYTVTLVTGSQDLLASAALTGSITLGQEVNTSFSVTAVPEPATYAMLLAGLGLVGWAARRKSHV